jgi:hypothetical protein
VLFASKGDVTAHTTVDWPVSCEDFEEFERYALKAFEQYRVDEIKGTVTKSTDEN